MDPPKVMKQPLKKASHEEDDKLKRKQKSELKSDACHDWKEKREEEIIGTNSCKVSIHQEEH